MNAIIIKINKQVIAVSQVTEVSSKKYLEIQEEARKNISVKDQQIFKLEQELMQAHKDIKELTKKVNYLGKQIAIDRGEIEEDDTNEYELVLKEKIVETSEEEIEDLPETEPLAIEEKEESEVNE